tara:strand:- start:1277 stop:1531 length:255 start_codon:yes stop_codon:yes gene_type:complete
MTAKRNYKKEYAKFQASKKQMQDRAKRNAARRKAVKAGRVKKGDGKDVHHPKGVNSKKTVVLSKSKNRGKAEKSRLKGSKRKKS